MAAGNGFGFESGSNGDTVTTGNSGSDALGSPLSGTMVISTAQKAHGTRSALLTADTASGVTYISKTITATDVLTTRVYVRWSALPAGTITPSLVWLGAGTSQLVNLEVTAAGLLRIRDDASANAWTSTTAMTTGTWYRVEFSVTRNASTGTVRAAIYSLDSTTAIEDSGIIAGKNTGASGITTVRIGVKCATGTMTATAYLDDWDYDPATTTFIGPPTNPAPAVSITGNQNLAAGATANVSVSATDDGSIASYAWTVVSASSTSTPTLTGASTSAVSFTVPAAGNLVTLQCVVTDDLGATTTVTTEVRVPKSGAFATLALAGVGSWANTGGAANAGAALADSSDTTYVESPDYSGVESEQRFRLEPLTSRSALTLVYRNQVTATGGTKKFRLYEGNVLRQEWTVPQHTAIQDDTFTVTTPGSISDWGGLWVAEAVVS